MSGEIELVAKKSELGSYGIPTADGEPVNVRSLLWVIDCVCSDVGLQVGDSLEIKDKAIIVTRPETCAFEWGEGFNRDNIPAKITVGRLKLRIADDGGKPGKLSCEKDGEIEPQVVWTAQEGSGWEGGKEKQA